MNLEDKEIALRGLRDRLLDFHKLLIDREKLEIEKMGGPITPGQWLGMLMGDEEYDWLRSISRLVVRIDESLEVDDGISPETVDSFLSEIKSLFDNSDNNSEFKENVGSSMANNPDADSIRLQMIEKLNVL